MKTTGLVFIGLALALAGVAVMLGYPELFHTETSSVTSEYRDLIYQDACVVEVTHPELQVELYRIETPSPGCSNCRYWFRIWNQTAAVGTKAYQTRILVVPHNQGIRLDSRTIEPLKLQGFITELPPIEYPVLHDQDYFVVEGLCPGCLFGDQAFIKLVIEYRECAGIRRFSCICDLRSQKVTVLNASFEATGDCCK